MRVFRVSAATGAGIEELKRALFELVPPDEVVPAAPGDDQELVDFLVYRPQPSRRAFRVFRTEDAASGSPDGRRRRRTSRRC